MCELSLDSCDVYREKWQVARKEHRCSSCRAAIKTGERYQAVFYVYEGYPDHEKACVACVTDLDAFVKVHHAGPSPSGFADALQECIDEGGEDSRRWQPVLNALIERAPAPPKEPPAT